MIKQISLLSLVLSACAADGPGTTSLTKREARGIDPATWATDHCQTHGWYGDGECDEFCPQVDGDCDAALAGEADAFLEEYTAAYAQLEKAVTLAQWDVSTSGTEEAYAAADSAQIKLATFYVNAERRARLAAFLPQLPKLPLGSRRSLEVVDETTLLGKNLKPGDLLQMLDVLQLRNDALREHTNFRAEIDGAPRSRAELETLLKQTTDGEKRQAIWEASRQVGERVAPKIVAAAEIANAVGAVIGCGSLWECMLRSTDQEPDEILQLFAEVDSLTAEPYAQMKAELDAEIAQRFGIAVDEVEIWHYDDPFFMAPPLPEEANLDELYRDRSGEAIVALAVEFYERLGLGVRDVLGRSDLYEREGKWPSAFMLDVDREGDIRVLLNVRPDQRWVATSLHEFGHAADFKYVERALPFLLRTSNHTFTTEAMALFFDDQSLTEGFLREMAAAQPDWVDARTNALLEHRRRSKLIFARFVLVMVNFERALYDDPQQDLDGLWWDLVERYQRVKRPPGRHAPDWACKTHFIDVPGYYHNYLMGELLAAQLRAFLDKRAGGDGKSALGYSVLEDAAGAQWIKDQVLRAGKELHWWEFAEAVTGEPLGAQRFADQLRTAFD